MLAQNVFIKLQKQSIFFMADGLSYLDTYCYLFIVLKLILLIVLYLQMFQIERIYHQDTHS